jgi:hypothetical protein
LDGLGGSGGIQNTIRIHTNRFWTDLTLQNIRNYKFLRFSELLGTRIDPICFPVCPPSPQSTFSLLASILSNKIANYKTKKISSRRYAPTFFPGNLLWSKYVSSTTSSNLNIVQQHFRSYYYLHLNISRQQHVYKLLNQSLIKKRNICNFLNQSLNKMIHRCKCVNQSLSKTTNRCKLLNQSLCGGRKRQGRIFGLPGGRPN